MKVYAVEWSQTIKYSSPPGLKGFRVAFTSAREATRDKTSRELLISWSSSGGRGVLKKTCALQTYANVRSWVQASLTAWHSRLEVCKIATDAERREGWMLLEHFTYLLYSGSCPDMSCMNLDTLQTDTTGKTSCFRMLRTPPYMSS